MFILRPPQIWIWVFTVGPRSPLDMPGGGSGDRLHCYCRPSFWDNVIMGRESWRLRFLSAQIFYDINNEHHSPAMSPTTQHAHDSILMRPFLLSPPFHSFYLSQFIFTPSPLLFFSLLSPISYVLPRTSIFSSDTNVFVLILIHISRCLYMLNEA